MAVGQASPDPQEMVGVGRWSRLERSGAECVWGGGYCLDMIAIDQSEKLYSSTTSRKGTNHVAVCFVECGKNRNLRLSAKNKSIDLRMNSNAGFRRMRKLG